MTIAIVTGASSGLGREFVKQLADEGGCAEIWAIARRKERLVALAAECSLPVRVLPFDLTKEQQIADLADLLEQEQPLVNVLVNAAGFGKMGDYRQVSREDADAIIDLNCRAAVDVTFITLPYMRQGSRIIEISSTSAFQPFPGLNVYAASKAFLLRFSRALRWELWERGIHVTAVCPYWVKDTEFIPIAQESGNRKAIRHFPFASRCHSVVRWALRDSRLNLAVSTPGPICFLHRIIAKFVPHGLMIAIWEGLRRL